MLNDVDHVVDMLHNMQYSHESLAELQQELIEHLASTINQLINQALKLKKHESFTALIELNKQIRNQLSHEQKDQIAVTLSTLDGSNRSNHNDFRDYEMWISVVYYRTFKDIKSIEVLIEYLNREHWPHRFNERTANIYKERVQLYRDLLVETELSGTPQDVTKVTYELSNKIRSLGDVYFYALNDTKEAHTCWSESYEIKNILINHESIAANYHYFGIDNDLYRLSNSYLKLNNERESIQAKRDQLFYKQKIYDIRQGELDSIALLRIKDELVQQYANLNMHEDSISIGLELIDDLKRLDQIRYIEIDGKTHHYPNLSRTQRYTSINYAHMQNYDEAFKLVGEISSAENSFSLYKETLREIAKIAQEKCDFNEAIRAEKKYLKTLRQKYLDQEYPLYYSELSDSLNHLSSLLIQLESYDEAIEFALESLEVSKQIDDDREHIIADALFNLRAIYDSSGLYDQALTTVKEEIRHQRSVLDVQLNILSYRKNDEYEVFRAKKCSETFLERVPFTYLKAQDITRALITVEDLTEQIIIDLIYFNIQFVVHAFNAGSNYIVKHHLEDLIERSIREASEYKAKLKDMSLMAELEASYCWAMALYQDDRHHDEEAKCSIERAFALSNDHFDSYMTFEHRMLSYNRLRIHDFDCTLLLYNDDDVTFETVFIALTEGLKITHEMAISLAQKTHDHGQSVIGSYPYSVILQLFDLASHVAKKHNSNQPTFVPRCYQVDLNTYSIKDILITVIEAAKSDAERGVVAKLLRELACMEYEPLMKASRSILSDKNLGLLIHQEIESGLLSASCASEEHKQSTYKKTLTKNEAKLLEQLSAQLQEVKQRPEVSALRELDYLRCCLWIEAAIHLIGSIDPSQDPNIFKLLSELSHQLNELTAQGSSQINEVIEVLSERLSCIKSNRSTLR